MGIKHVFTDLLADGTNPLIVRPSDWNSNHAYTLQDAVSFAGNTSGVLANVSSGTLILAGGNNITLSQNGNSVTISGANAGGAQTGISSVIVSDATYTSGLVSFSNQNGVTIGSSVNGASQYIRLSVANQSAQTGISSVIVSDATYTSGLISFSNQNGVTFGSSVNGATQYIRASVANQTNQSLGIYASSNTTLTSSGTIDARSLSIRGVGAISVGHSNGEVILSVVAGAQSNQSLGIYASSNTTLTSSGTIDARSLSIRGIGGASIGFSASEVLVSVAPQSTLSATGFLSLSTNGSTIYIGAGPLSVYASSNTTLTSSGTVDGRSLSVRGVGAISVGHSNGEIVLSVAAGAQSNQTIGVYVSSNSTLTSSGTIDARSLSVRFIGSITGGYSANELLISAPNALTSQSTAFLALTLGGNTAGTSTFHATNNQSLFFNGGANITLSGNGSTVTIVGAAGAAATAISGIIVSDATYTSGTVSFSNQNGVTIGSSVNGASQYIRLSVANQTNQSMGIYASSNTTLTSSGTVDARSMSIRAIGSLTVGVSASEWILSAPNALTIQSNQSIGGYGLGNTTLTSSSTWDARSLSFAGAGAITVGYSSNSGLFISAPVTSSLSATGIVSISTNGSTISIGAPGFSGGISTDGNTAGSTGLVSRRINFVGSNGITLSGSTDAGLGSATITIRGNPIISQYDPYWKEPVTNSSLGQSTIYIQPFDVPYEISGSRINFYLSLTHTFSGAPANSTAWLAAGYALYTRMTGASSERISLLTSYSMSYVSASASSSTRLSVTNYIGLSNATSHSTSQYGVLNASVSDYLGSSIAGFRVLAMPLNLTLAPGRSWLAFSIQSASQGASIVLGHSVLQNQFSNNIAYRVLGAVSAASNASFFNVSDGLGIYSAQSAAFPASIPLSSDSIRGAPVMTLPYFNISGIGTSSNIL